MQLTASCLLSGKIENLNEIRVKELRSDNGTEFRNHKLEEFCDEKAARTMLNSAKLPKQFWGEAVNTACYTQNRSIIVKRHGKTAYDVFRGRSPDISYFHVFGCPVHIHNHRDHLGKFDEKADDGFFLGYSPVAKAFRFLGNTEYFPYIPAYENITPVDSLIPQDSVSSEEPPELTSANDHPALNKLDQPESPDNLESFLNTDGQEKSTMNINIIVKTSLLLADMISNSPHVYVLGSGFYLKVYSDSDYAGCNLDRKSTSRACQILGGKLVCWSAKKQSSVVMSSAKAEYVVAVRCCAQVLWIKSQLADYDVLYDKVPIFCDNKVPLPFLTIQYCILGQNILTSCITSSETTF
ncbi:retrovirus-related pol polyprotein from transposon TNT 1-94 [Tanacetum coccineum]